MQGILLFGPPGTGKTLMARQIGQMLNSREPKIVNGPQILDKYGMTMMMMMMMMMVVMMMTRYVGESEANIRSLFEEAEEEERRLGPNSGLHIIIFDEIDAICKARGSQAGIITLSGDPLAIPVPRPATPAASTTRWSTSCCPR